ncbi:hypothetical protein [Mycobacterium sp.]|uniref:hypothetical protein n=1 Tax=Mycobacterium sp. TaxID=1785 RepID=UPI003C717880
MQQASAYAADLWAAIAELAGLVAGSLGLPELLTEVSTFAVHCRRRSAFRRPLTFGYRNAACTAGRSREV